MFTIHTHDDQSALPVVFFGSTQLPVTPARPLDETAKELGASVSELSFSIAPTGSWHTCESLQVKAFANGESLIAGFIKADGVVVKGRPELDPEFLKAVLDAAVADTDWPAYPKREPAEIRDLDEFRYERDGMQHSDRNAVSPSPLDDWTLREVLFGHTPVYGALRALHDKRWEALVAARTAQRMSRLLDLCGQPRVSIDDFEQFDDELVVKLVDVAMDSWPRATMRGALFNLLRKPADFDERVGAMLASRPALNEALGLLDASAPGLIATLEAGYSVAWIAQALKDPLATLCGEYPQTPFVTHLALRIDVWALPTDARPLTEWSRDEIDAVLTANEPDKWRELLTAFRSTPDDGYVDRFDDLVELLKRVPRPMRVPLTRLAAAKERGFEALKAALDPAE